MASRGKAFVVVALLTSLAITGYSFAQTMPGNKADKEAAASSRPAATTTKAAPTILTVVPADAWGVIGANNLERLDSEVMRLASKLSLPIFFQPSGLLQMGLGITQGFDARGGLGVIFLDKMKYGQAKDWETFNNLPAPIVLAIAATDPQLLIKSMGGQPGEEEGTFTATLGKDAVVAAVKGSYVLFSPDADLVKAVAGVGAPATRPATATLPASLVRQIDGSNLFVLVNVKSIASAVDPLVRGLIQMLGAAAQAQSGAEATPNMSVVAGAYFDILTKQVDRLVILGNLESEGLMLSGLLTFQPNTLLNKAFAAIKPTDQTLLSTLPDGQFVLAAGGASSGEQYVKEVAELFSKPMLDALKSSGNPTLVAAAEQQTKIMNLRVQLNQMQKAGRVGVYVQPNAENGLLAVVVDAQFEDGVKAYDLIKQIAKLQAESASAQQTKAKEFLEAVTYTPEAETVDSTKVNVLLLDVTKLPKIAPNMTEKQGETLIKIVKTLLGTDGLTVRIAVGEKNIVATLGGGTAVLKKAIDLSKSNAAPLAKQQAIAKIQDRLPKNRIGAVYVSAENLLSTVDQVAKVLGEEPLPFEPGQTSAPLAGMMLSDPVGMHVGLYVPTELMVNIRTMIAQGMQKQRTGRAPGAASQPAKPEAEPQTEPKPEF